MKEKPAETREIRSLSDVRLVGACEDSFEGRRASLRRTGNDGRGKER
jgi:hypothetical protein